MQHLLKLPEQAPSRETSGGIQTAAPLPGPGCDPLSNPLPAYLQGLLSQSLAIRQLGLRDPAELPVALGNAGLSTPKLSAQAIDAQATEFAELWKRA